jgi:hypothetical protein
MISRGSNNQWIICRNNFYKGDRQRRYVHQERRTQVKPDKSMISDHTQVSFHAIKENLKSTLWR